MHLLYWSSAPTNSFWPCFLILSEIPFRTLRFMSLMEFSPSLFRMSSNVVCRISLCILKELHWNRKWYMSSGTWQLLHKLETLVSIFALWLLRIEWPDNSWLRAEKLFLSSSPKQYLQILKCLWTRLWLGVHGCAADRFLPSLHMLYMFLFQEEP